jgi:hypothetical protein
MLVGLALVTPRKRERADPPESAMDS